MFYTITYLRLLNVGFCEKVTKEGFEPSRRRRRNILSVVCLPVPPLGLISAISTFARSALADQTRLDRRIVAREGLEPPPTES